MSIFLCLILPLYFSTQRIKDSVTDTLIGQLGATDPGLTRMSTYGMN